MQPFRIRRAAVVLAVPLTILILADALHQSGVRINLSASEPIGIYLMQALKQQAIGRNSLIEFCPPVGPREYPFIMTGACANAAAPFMKHVIGVPGDTVEETDQGVWINGQAVKDSKPKDRTSANQPLPRWRGQKTLDKDEYWVYGSGDPQNSFDSRYYGPIKVAQIISTGNSQSIKKDTLNAN